ncbi:hypothetical protein PQ478_19420 [Alkalihalophilus pseudofirmus]|uniref:hypothetical protein n=1 Tax=Alkalihalophilus pseudofirmus TaxID=79885 RepID=UPI00259B5FE7|nr:hypothetical protein [Alkalihalophilus pseudofirmus]WEG16649.1 hypothetical protein PQ478_19420 [Alkalihalophilus pseudofirmus]
MSEARDQFARTLYIQSLPEPDRNVYQYIDRIEAELEELALTQTHYLQLLRRQSPIKQAAKHFNMNEKMIYETVQRIESELADCVPELSERLELVEFTDVLKLKGLCDAEDEKKYFVLNRF